MNFSVTKLVLIGLTCFLANTQVSADARIYEQSIEMDTYSFSDPDPVAKPGKIYPYFRFDGFTNEPKLKSWKMIVLENDFIKVWVAPEIGGKVWRAIEKSTGRDFVYFNDVVKYRAVAMRGPWTSGGIEFNFGTVGHTVSVATPVDYTIRANEDGSVSCIVGDYDFSAQTRWSVEIRLGANQAYFTTKANWHNLGPLPTSYYHWTNAAARASGDLEFSFPGSHYIGHGTEREAWPLYGDKNLSWYHQNDFGSYKSYHVLGEFSEFFGGYYHDENFGFGHWAPYDEKPGKKLWIWGLSREGMIWEDLLTDNNGQYVEWQSGKLFNQPDLPSSLTPFKHRTFAPGDSDSMIEYWFPLVESGPADFVAGLLVFGLEQDSEGVRVSIQALSDVTDSLSAFRQDDLLDSREIDLKTLETSEFLLTGVKMESLNLTLGSSGQIFKAAANSKILERPLEIDSDFDFTSEYGLFEAAGELEAQRLYSAALEAYLELYKKAPSFTPVLNRIASIYYRRADYDQTLYFSRKALSRNTYDAEANYLYGLAQSQLGDLDDALSGFAVAAADPKFRVPAYIQLAKHAIRGGNAQRALNYAQKAIDFNNSSLTGWQLKTMALRELGRQAELAVALEKIESLDPTYLFVPFERTLGKSHKIAKQIVLDSSGNEFRTQSLLELALIYFEAGDDGLALRVLSFADPHPIVAYWQAYLMSKSGQAEEASKKLRSAATISPHLVFPFRRETLKVLEFAKHQMHDWQLNYYLALIYVQLDRNKEALNELLVAGDRSGYAPFYLFRSRHSPETQEKDIEKALRLAPTDWRVQHSAADYWSGERGDKHAEMALRLNPNSSRLILDQAERFFRKGELAKGFDFLELQTVLPNEGLSSIRYQYHRYSIVAALDALAKKDTVSATSYLEQSRSWPENLGSGRPYQPDERIADFLMAHIAGLDGDSDQANRYLSKLLGSLAQQSETSILQLVAAQRLGETEALNRLNTGFASDSNEMLQSVVKTFNDLPDAGLINDIELVELLLADKKDQ